MWTDFAVKNESAHILTPQLHTQTRFFLSNLIIKIYL